MHVYLIELKCKQHFNSPTFQFFRHHTAFSRWLTQLTTLENYQYFYQQNIHSLIDQGSGDNYF